MSRYPFIVGESYSRDYIVDVVEMRIRDGTIKNQDAARRWLKQVRKCPFETLVWTPFAESFGRSPMNPNAWRTEDGKAIWNPHRIRGG